LEESLPGWGKLKPAAGKPLPEKMAAGNCLDHDKSKIRSGLPRRRFQFCLPPGSASGKKACQKPLILVMLVAVDALSGGRLN
jgi:hypothetical protein